MSDREFTHDIELKLARIAKRCSYSQKFYARKILLHNHMAYLTSEYICGEIKFQNIRNLEVRGRLCSEILDIGDGNRFRAVDIGHYYRPENPKELERTQKVIDWEIERSETRTNPTYLLEILQLMKKVDKDATMTLTECGNHSVVRFFSGRQMVAKFVIMGMRIEQPDSIKYLARVGR